MNKTSLESTHMQWLSILGFMYAQQNQHHKALPVLSFVHENSEFQLNISIQLIQCLQALKQFEKSHYIIKQCLKQSLPQEHVDILNTLNNINQLFSKKNTLNKSEPCHE